MTDNKKILVVGQLSGNGKGDNSSNPLRYFQLGQSQILSMNLHIERTDTGISRATQARDQADAIIIGGGSPINHPHLEADMEFWTKASVPMVLWGAGREGNDAFALGDKLPELEEYHQLRSFALIGLRDSGAGFNWVPCASCMHPLFSQKHNRSKGVVFAFQHALRNDPDKLASATIKQPDALISFDDSPLADQIGILSQAETVVTNSYEAAYWSTLLGKRVIAVGGGTSMRMLKHAPAMADMSTWRNALDLAVSYPDALEECRETNIRFGKRVARLASRTSRHIPFVRDPIAERAEEIPVQQAPAIIRNLVPRIIHFVFGLSPDFGGKPFNLMHQIAVRSAHDRIKPEQIFFHYRHEPSNALFDEVKGLLTLVPLPPRDADMPTHFAHQADIIRLDALYEQGGIYLDLDTITVDSFDPLLQHPFTLGVQGRTRLDGLCNAVMLAAPGNAYIKDWLDSYDRFSDVWDLFSVRLPYLKWRSGQWHPHVEPYDSFHWPSWGPEGLKAMFERDIPFPNARCHHLWETLSYPLYFKGDHEEIAHIIRNGRSTYSRLARPYLS